jgi:hypothetical protein
MSIDAGYFFVVSAFVGLVIALFILWDYYRFVKWVKEIESRPEASPYVPTDRVKLTKRQVKLFNEVYENARRESDAMYKQRISQ